MQRSLVIKTKETQLADLAGEMKPGHLGIATGLVNGLNQGEAYLSAGYLSKDPRQRASDIIRTNPYIGWYVDLAKEIASLVSQEALIGTVEQKRAILWKIVSVCSSHASMTDEELESALASGAPIDQTLLADPKTAISALAELNKMDGSHAAIKGEITGANGAPISHEVTSWIIEGVTPGVTIENESAEPMLIEQS